jgi:hypothetical protein
MTVKQLTFTLIDKTDSAQNTISMTLPEQCTILDLRQKVGDLLPRIANTGIVFLISGKKVHELSKTLGEAGITNGATIPIVFTQ